MKPDYRLKLLDKRTKETNINAGAAWVHPEKGHISIVLSPGVHLERDPDLMITLFPLFDYNKED